VFQIAPGGEISEIIDATGDGLGNALNNPFGLAATPGGNVYITGFFSSNAFEISPSIRVPTLGRVGLLALLAATGVAMLVWGRRSRDGPPERA